MKIFSWNVNGIRSVFKTTFKEWLRTNDPDIICLQEIKADRTDLSEEFTQIDGYYAYFNSGLRKGHAGVVVYTKSKPISIETKLGIERFDDEGRCLKLTFKDFTLFNFYIPNGARDKSNIGYKLSVYSKLFPIFQSLTDTSVILTGDFNIAHTEMDLIYPKQNQNNTMFTPEERKQLDTLLEIGYVDAFRYKYPNKKLYTWWPYAFNCRENDKGWRIDYFFVTKNLKDSITEVFMQREVLGSDHGPLGLILDIKLDAAEEVQWTKAPSTTPTLFD